MTRGNLPEAAMFVAYAIGLAAGWLTKDALATVLSGIRERWRERKAPRPEGEAAIQIACSCAMHPFAEGQGVTDDLRQRVADEAARQASAAQAARSHSDPDAPERARAHDFCAAVLESLLEQVVRP